MYFLAMFVSSLVIVKFIYSFLRWFCLFNRYKNYLGSRIRRADRARNQLKLLNLKEDERQIEDEKKEQVLGYHPGLYGKSSVVNDTAVTELEGKKEKTCKGKCCGLLNEFKDYIRI